MKPVPNYLIEHRERHLEPGVAFSDNPHDPLWWVRVHFVSGLKPSTETIRASNPEQARGFVLARYPFADPQRVEVLGRLGRIDPPVPEQRQPTLAPVMVRARPAVTRRSAAIEPKPRWVAPPGSRPPAAVAPPVAVAPKPEPQPQLEQAPVAEIPVTLPEPQPEPDPEPVAAAAAPVATAPAPVAPSPSAEPSAVSEPSAPMQPLQLERLPRDERGRAMFQPDTAARIQAAKAAGWTWDRICAALGCSHAQAERKLRALRGGSPTPRATSQPAVIPAPLPSDAPIVQALMRVGDGYRMVPVTLVVHSPDVA